MDNAWVERFAASDLDLTNVYETVMMPRLFAPWAEVLVDSLAPAPGATVVDVATGPGTVARAAARRVGVIGRVVGCDVSPGMLAAAARHPGETGAAPIDYLQCAADELSLPDGVADGVTCQHGMQFFPDRVGALAEMRRVTRRGGRLAVAVWGPIEQSPLFAALADGVATVFGPHAGAAYRQGPWSITDRSALAGPAVEAGWQDVDVATRVLPVDFDGGAAQLVASLGVTPLGPRVAELADDDRRALVAAVADALGPVLEADGVVRSATSALFLLATA